MSAPPLAPILPWPAAARVAVIVLAILLLVPPAAAARARWRWPARGQVVGGFHFDSSRRFAAGQRRGIVVAARPGTPVRAACAGPVTFAGRVARSGLVVSQACGRLSASYLRVGTIDTRRGMSLAPGDELGRVGPSGRYGLGARVRSRRDGYLDPLTLLRGAPLAAPRIVTPTGRVSPLPAPLPEPSLPAPPPIAVPGQPAPMRPAAAPSRERPTPAPLRPDAAPASARSPAGELGLPFGLWWLPTGCALLGAAAIIGLARHVARPRPARRLARRPRAQPVSTTESRPT